MGELGVAGLAGPQGPRKKSDGGPDAPPVRPKKQDSGKPGGNPKKSEACATGRFGGLRTLGRAVACDGFEQRGTYDKRLASTTFGKEALDLLKDVTPRVHHTIPQRFRKRAFAKIDLDHPCLTTALSQAAHRHLHRKPGNRGGLWNDTFMNKVFAKTGKDISPLGSGVIEPTDMNAVLEVIDEMSSSPQFAYDQFADVSLYRNAGSTKVPTNLLSAGCVDARPFAKK